jgi:hypothetical protein
VSSNIPLHNVITDGENAALAWACSNGSVEILRLLLADTRVSPSADHVASACGDGKVEIVSMLLADSRMNSPEMFCGAIQSAAANARPQVRECRVCCCLVLFVEQSGDNCDLELGLVRVSLFIVYSSLTTLLPPSACLHSVFQHTCEKAVELLLSDKRVNPAVDDNKAIYSVCSLPLLSSPENTREQLQVLQLLIADSRVDPSANNQAALLSASSNGRQDFVEILLACPRVVATKDALCAADSSGSESLVKLLLESNSQVSFLLYWFLCVYEAP